MYPLLGRTLLFFAVLVLIIFIAFILSG